MKIRETRNLTEEMNHENWITFNIVGRVIHFIHILNTESFLLGFINTPFNQSVEYLRKSADTLTSIIDSKAVLHSKE
jgi:hypothetical protein